MARRSLSGRIGIALALALWMFIVAPHLATGQEKPEPKAATAPSPKPEPGQPYKVYPEGWVTKVFQLKHADPSGVMLALRMFSGEASNYRESKLVMWTGPKELTFAVEDTVKRLDVAPAPAANLDLTFYLLLGSKQGGEGGALPPELDGVAKQVKGIFGLTGVSLLETAAIRTREGSGGRTEGVIKSSAEATAPTDYEISFERASVTTDERGRAVRLGQLNLRVEVRTVTKAIDGKTESVGRRPLRLSTDIDIREGQKAVVGKTTVDSSGTALFLVATAKVVD